VLVGRPEGKRPFGRPRRKREDNIKMDFQDVNWGGLDRIDLPCNRNRRQEHVNAVMEFRVL